MTTNYYLKPADAVGSADEGLHIGLSAFGRRFLFQGHADLGLVTFAAWSDRLGTGGVIVDDMGCTHPAADFLAWVERQQTAATAISWWEEPGASKRPDDTRFVDPDGYSFDTTEFC